MFCKFVKIMRRFCLNRCARLIFHKRKKRDLTRIVIVIADSIWDHRNQLKLELTEGV